MKQIFMGIVYKALLILSVFDIGMFCAALVYSTETQMSALIFLTGLMLY